MWFNKKFLSKKSVSVAYVYSYIEDIHEMWRDEKTDNTYNLLKVVGKSSYVG